jgi:hypothetical protein
VKIVINRCCGGFGLSEEARRFFPESDCDRDIERNDPELIRVVEEMGERANGDFGSLCVVEWNENVPYNIYDRGDGYEIIEVNYRAVLSALLENQDLSAIHATIVEVLKS